MNTWYKVGVKFTKEYPDGTLKRVTENFLVNTFSFTDSEARIYKEVGEFVRGEFVIASMAKQGYADIFNYDDSDTWFESKVSYTTEDADSGRETKVNNKYLVNANNIKEAYDRIEESLKGLMVTYSIPSITKTGIQDVFAYEPTTESEETE